MNLAGTIVADEANIIAIDAMNAGDLAEPSPARAMVGGDLAIDRLDIRRVRENAAGIVASHRRTGAGKFGAPSQRGAAAAQGRGGNHSERDRDVSNHGKASQNVL